MLVFQKARLRVSPALREESTPSEKRVARALVEARRKVEQWIERNETALMDAIAHRPWTAVADMIPDEPWYEFQEFLQEELLAEAIDAGFRAVNGPVGKATTPVLGYRFDATRPEASQWAARESGNMVTEITRGQRQVIRDVVSRGQVEGITVDQTARTVRQSVGLTTQQSGWVDNFYYRRVDENMRSGMGLNRAEQVARQQTSRYHDRIHRYRAETIARTEIARAASEGRQLAWNQGIEQGFISAKAQKEWIAESDACEICSERNGKKHPVGKPWPDGEPPAHPNCRCDLLLIPFDFDEEEEERSRAARVFATLSTFDEILTGVRISGRLTSQQIDYWRRRFESRSYQTESERKTFGEIMEAVLEPEQTAYASDGTEFDDVVRWIDRIDDLGDGGLDDDLSDVFTNIYSGAIQNNPKMLEDFIKRHASAGRTADNTVAGVESFATLLDEGVWQIYVSGNIYDSNTGQSLQEIFSGKRTLYLKDRRVYHDLFEVDEDFQGYGIGRYAHDALMSLYRAQGIERVELEANIDVGGYTWARFGFDWKGRRPLPFDGDPDEPADVEWYQTGVERDHARIKDFIEDRIDVIAMDMEDRLDDGEIDIDYWDEVNEETTNILYQLEENPASDWPTPLQIAMIGYRSGLDSWPGKRALLRSRWNGVFYL